MISMTAANCAASAAELGLQPIWSNGQAYQNPLLLRVYDQHGQLQADWIGQRYGLIGWTTQPELLLFITTHGARRYLVAGDPTDGRLYTVSRDIGARRWLESPTKLLVANYDDGYRESIVPLPAPVSEPGWLNRNREEDGRFRVINNAVQFDDRVLLDNHGLPHFLIPSPSRRWMLATEDQLDWTPIIYAISTDGSRRVQAIRVAEPAELPLERQQPARTSPDGQWTVSFRRWPWGILLTHRDGEQRLYRSAPIDGPWWSPDSQQFAYLAGNRMVVVDLADRSRETDWPNVFDGGRTVLSPVPQVLLGWTPQGLAWLINGSSDHNDHGPPPRNWQETLE